MNSNSHLIPALDRYYFYLYRDFRDGDNPISFVQLIAHADKFVDAKDITTEKHQEIQQNRKLCGIFYEDAWSSRDGIVYFIKNEFTKKEEALLYYEELLTWANNFRLSQVRSKIKNLIPLIQEHYDSIKSLTWEQEEAIEELQTRFEEYMFSSDALRLISNKILRSPNDFCRDENGEDIDIEFSGKLSSFSESKVPIRDYTVLKGKILGECTYYFKGQLKETAILDGSVHRDSIKRWYSDGQIEFEKTYNCVRYWHKNGQLKLEKIKDHTTVWDDAGNKTKEFKKS